MELPRESTSEDENNFDKEEQCTSKATEKYIPMLQQLAQQIDEEHAKEIQNLEFVGSKLRETLQQLDTKREILKKACDQIAAQRQQLEIEQNRLNFFQEQLISLKLKARQKRVQGIALTLASQQSEPTQQDLERLTILKERMQRTTAEWATLKSQKSNPRDVQKYQSITQQYLAPQELESLLADSHVINIP